MRTIYLDLSSGAAGDMLAAALLALHPDPQSVISRLTAALPPEITLTYEPAVMSSSGITGSRFHVAVRGQSEAAGANGQDTDAEHCHHHHEHHDHHHDNSHGHSHDHGHSHRHLQEVMADIERLKLPEDVLGHIRDIYTAIAGAEACAHGVAPGEVHFHEVGSLDALADISAVALLMHDLAPDSIIGSVIATGSGQVRCAHGLIPVPAPATTALLTGLPVTSGDLPWELCTPTGAALIAHFVTGFGSMPPMILRKSGAGLGQRQPEGRLNAVRAFLGDSLPECLSDSICELKCNIDDMTAEELAHACGILLQAGAVDVWQQSVYGKKNRLGVMLTCLCRPGDREKLVQAVFRHTSTLGIRIYDCARYVLSRRTDTSELQGQTVRIKHAAGFGTEKSKCEYEDLAGVAGRHCDSLMRIKSIIRKR